MPAPVPFLRQIARLEGISFLVLLFVAMPFKYLLQQPWPVKIVGWLHGVLFVVFCLSLLRAFLAARPPLLEAAWVFIASLLPFAPFYADRTLATWRQE